MRFTDLKVGYAPYSRDLSEPGDRRRFPRYAEMKGIKIEEAHPSRSYDIVYLSSRADITTWAQYEGKGRIVFELIDSYLALPVLSPRSVLRGVGKFAIGELGRPVLNYRRAIEQMGRRADAIVCSTEEQRVDLMELCENVHVILDFHDEIYGDAKNDFRRGDALDLVWEGLPQNVVGLTAAAPAFKEIGSRYQLRLHLITGLHYYRYLGRVLRSDTRRLITGLEEVRLHPWNLQTFADLVTTCDMAVIPIDLSDPFAMGKPENKLMIFWRLGMPTVTSATPAYVRAMDSAGTALYCTTAKDWVDKISELADSETRRKEVSLKGRHYVDRVHSVDALNEKWDGLLESLF